MTNTVIGGDLFTPEKIRAFHKETMETFDLPKWIETIVCANCGKKIELIGIRNISLCLNASRIGDIAVDVSCFECSKSYTVFYRNACRNVEEFFIALKSPMQPSVPEAQMSLTIQDNNLLESMIELHEKGFWDKKWEL